MVEWLIVGAAILAAYLISRYVHSIYLRSQVPQEVPRVKASLVSGGVYGIVIDHAEKGGCHDKNIGNLGSRLQEEGFHVDKHVLLALLREECRTNPVIQKDILLAGGVYFYVEKYARKFGGDPREFARLHDLLASKGYEVDDCVLEALVEDEHDKFTQVKVLNEERSRR